MNHPAPPEDKRFMRWAKSRPVMIGMMFIMISAPFLPICLGAHLENPDLGDMTVGILLYLDDGQYCWTDVPMIGNFTALCATIAACTGLNVPLNYSMSQYGAFVTSLFGTSAPSDFSWWWELLLWNSTANAWQEAPSGASDLHPEPWSSIAWCPNSSAPPLPDPLTRYPWPKFRGDLANTGRAIAPYRANMSIHGETSGGNGPIDSSPVMAHGRLFVSTGGVYNWSRMEYEQPPRIWSTPPGSMGPFWFRETTAAGWQVSTPAVGGGKVIIGTSDGKVLAFAMDDLKPLWNYSIAPSSTGVTSSPVIFQGTVYIAGGDGQLYALTLDGKLLWNLSLGGPVYMSSPAISKGRLFVGSDAGVLTCTGLNGTLMWNFTTEGKIRSSPAISGDRVYFEDTVYDGFTAVRSTFFALRADEGIQEWNKTISAATSSPAVTGGRIFLGTNLGVIALDLSGNQLWFHPTSGPVQSSPTVASDSVMVCENSPNGTFYILSAPDGRELYSYTPHPQQYMFASPIFTGDKLVIASDNGRVYQDDLYYAPNLALASVRLSGALSPDKMVEVKVTINNTGTLVARNVKITLYGHYGNKVIDASINITHLAPGKNVTAVFNWTPKEGKNDLTISARAAGMNTLDRAWDYQVPGKRRYPAELNYVSLALLVSAAVIVILFVQKRSRKGGRR